MSIVDFRKEKFFTMNERHGGNHKVKNQQTKK